MAKLENKKIVSGMVSNVIFRKVNDKQLVQSRPTKRNDLSQQQGTNPDDGGTGRRGLEAKNLRI